MSIFYHRFPNLSTSGLQNRIASDFLKVIPNVEPHAQGKSKGYLNGHPIMVQTFLVLHVPLSRRFDQSENWLSSRCLTSMITRDLVFPS